MRRRDFFLAAAMLAPAMRHAMAQQSAKTKRIAVVNPSTKVADFGADPNFLVFLEELKRLGYVEGTNLIVDRYSGEGRTDRYDDLVREVVSTHPDLIWCSGSPLTRRFKAATSTIPIVALTGDPIRFGLVSSIARPGGNTGGHNL
jgi:putative ABC transport system substrate-binding protein